jgi:dolichol-phosphate mannosyltransferase
MAKIFLGLPAYNEEASIAPLFQKVEDLNRSLPEPLTVIVYDDGCTDGTKEQVSLWMERLDISYLDGIVNKGLGEGMNALLHEFASKGKDGDLLVVMDCDDTHDPAQIPEMTSVISAYPGTDVVIASRYRRGATITGVPFSRVLLSIGAALLYKMVHPARHVRDYTCGYRAYTFDVVGRTTSMYGSDILKERGFACMVELLLKVKNVGARFREIPMRLAYDNKLSASKMDVSGNTWRLLKKLVSWRLTGI